MTRCVLYCSLWDSLHLLTPPGRQQTPYQRDESNITDHMLNPDIMTLSECTVHQELKQYYGGSHKRTHPKSPNQKK